MLKELHIHSKTVGFAMPAVIDDTGTVAGFALGKDGTPPAIVDAPA